MKINKEAVLQNLDSISENKEPLNSKLALEDINKSFSILNRKYFSGSKNWILDVRIDFVIFFYKAKLF